MDAYLTKHLRNMNQYSRVHLTRFDRRDTVCRICLTVLLEVVTLMLLKDSLAHSKVGNTNHATPSTATNCLNTHFPLPTLHRALLPTACDELANMEIYKTMPQLLRRDLYSLLRIHSITSLSVEHLVSKTSTYNINHRRLYMKSCKNVFA